MLMAEAGCIGLQLLRGRHLSSLGRALKVGGQLGQRARVGGVARLSSGLRGALKPGRDALRRLFELGRILLLQAL